MATIETKKNSAGILRKIKNSIFYIKLTNWEYWPLSIANIPLIFTWLWFAIKARKLFFFSAVNPVIETGGMWGESKYNILKRIPQSHVPITVFVKKGTGFYPLKKELVKKKMEYPVIAKPDIGERGMLVSKIKNERELENYLNANDIDFLVQEFISLPMELSVMHHRLPGSSNGKITSICIKKTLEIKGDGVSTVKELMETTPRAKLQLARFEKQFPEILKHIPANGEALELEPIGNHCRGTMFLNGNEYIDDKLTEAFDEIAFQMRDIYYGRFDLKCNSIEDLKNGGEIKIMEYNGIGSEPAHIYDPSYPLFKKYQDIFFHWKTIYKIYKIQRKKGIKGMSVKEAAKRLKNYIEYKKSIKPDWHINSKAVHQM